MALFRYKNSKNWWYDFQFDGRRYRESTKTSSRTLAREAECARKRQLQEGFNSIRPRTKPKPLNDAVKDYLEAKALTVRPTTLEIETNNSQRLVRAFGKKLLTEITAKDIRKYQLDRLAKGSAPKTVNLDVSTLRGILRRNNLWAEIQPDVRMLKVPDDIGKAITVHEEQLLLTECRKSRARSFYVAVVMALSTCMRYSEIKLLKWKNIDLIQRFIKVGESKTRHGEGRRIPINNRLMKVLESWAANFPNRTPDHYVFPSEKVGERGKVYATDPTRHIRSWKAAWRFALKRAGLQFRFHDLRHTGCTRMLESGVPFAVVADIMGWSAATAILMSKRYGHIGHVARKQAVDLLNGPEILPDQAAPSSPSQTVQ